MSTLQLTHNDYKKVLNYYNVPIPKTNKQTKIHAENILSNKLCKCIQKVKKSIKQRNKSLTNKDLLRNSVGICRKSVLHNKHVDAYQFLCDKTRKFKNYPNKKYTLKKFQSKSMTRKNTKKL